MDSLFLNFLKRAVLVPLLAAAIVAGGFMFIGTKAAAESNVEPSKPESSVNLTGYTVKSYKTFDELKQGNYVCALSCESAWEGEKAVLFSESDGNSITMSKNSVEPWNKGGVLIIGNNTDAQFKGLHNAVNGDTVEVSFYDNGSYSYTVKKVIPCAEEEKLNSFVKNNTLVLCLSYNNFTNLGNAYFYRVVIAERN
ncbi:MAG: sortase [Eubacterium sp.]|nr:sortase [Eubacterium sp.]